MAFVQDRRFISPRYGATPESSLGQTSSSFRRDLALLDNEIDFLTGSPASTLTLEMAHLLNTVRSDPDRRNIIVSSNEATPTSQCDPNVKYLEYVGTFSVFVKDRAR